MTEIGFTRRANGQPDELLDHARRAEGPGPDAVFASDPIRPWSERFDVQTIPRHGPTGVRTRFVDRFGGPALPALP